MRRLALHAACPLWEFPDGHREPGVDRVQPPAARWVGWVNVMVVDLGGVAYSLLLVKDRAFHA